MEGAVSDQDDTEINTTPYPLALIRIALGIGFGAILISILFSIWTAVNDKGGPIIGVFVFQLIAFGAIAVVGVNAIFRRVELV